MTKTRMSAQALRNVLDYDPRTGLFIWKVRISNVFAGSTAGSLKETGYIKIGFDGKEYFAHVLAWLMFYGRSPNHRIDHINGIKDDNRIENLRDVRHQINQQNFRGPMSTNKAGLLGVCSRRDGGFYSLISVGGKRKYLGTFSSAADAHQAYVIAKRKLHEGCTI